MNTDKHDKQVIDPASISGAERISVFLTEEKPMRKFILISLTAAAPLFAQAADINVNVGNVRVQTPGVSVTITFGDRDRRGYYWDGYDWREPEYWKRHHGPRGKEHYTGWAHGKKGKNFCPPGQAKKDNC
jgi:hypothetical protein